MGDLTKVLLELSSFLSEQETELEKKIEDKIENVTHRYDYILGYLNALSVMQDKLEDLYNKGGNEEEDNE